MGSPPTTTDDELLSLDPLDGLLVGIRPPFHSPSTPKATLPYPDLPSSIPFPRLPSSNKRFVDDETPTTAAASLPTPGPLSLTLTKPTYADVVRGYERVDRLPWYPNHVDDSGSYLDDAGDLGVKDIGAMPSFPPPAPILRDMDSFTDGTYAGSFDFSLYSLDDVTPSFPHDVRPAPESLAFSPEEPLRSIEHWREDVLTSTGPTSPERSRGTDEDVAGTPESPGHLGPRGIKRHLSWTSDAYRDHDGGPERARGRWEALRATSSDTDARYSCAFLGDGSCDERMLDYASDGPLYSFEDDLGYVSDDVFISPPRPISAPPYT